MSVDRIVSSHGGTCATAGSGFQCTTKLAPPTCSSCAGGDLNVQFKGTGPGRTWVATSTGGHWQIAPFEPGHADLIATAAHAQMSVRRSG
jgi:hypothetical protein